VSIVVPAYNEEGCIEELAARLGNVFDNAVGVRFEAIIVDNGSRDRTLELLIGVAKRDSRFTVLQMSKPFGADNGITAGLAHAQGDAAVILMADLQDPPELIPDFIELWRSGFDNVYGVVRSRSDTGILRRAASQVYYWLVGRLSSDTIPRNVSDFRLVDRAVIDAITAMPERRRFLRTMIGWTGFRSVGVPFDRAPRFAGESHASRQIGWVIHNAITSLLSISGASLAVIPVVGFLMSVGAVLAFILMALNAVFRGVPFPGFGTLVATQLLVFGTLSLFLGVIAQYVGMIYDEVRQRPTFLVRRVIRFSPDSHADGPLQEGDEDA
jgi:dolichol-phosphate mannosyltransferase